MTKKPSSTEKSRTTAMLLALLVTFLWASSFILIKFGLKDGLPPITFAGLRYSLAFLCLLPLVLFNKTHCSALVSIPRALWIKLILLGITFYTITQGTNFLGLSLLPTHTVSLIYNFGPFFIALASGWAIKEPPSLVQWLGVLLSILGALVYFLPLQNVAESPLGYIVALVSVLAHSFSSLLGRNVNLKSGLSPIVITTVSMGIGGLLLLVVGGLSQGFGQLDLSQWLIIGWLAVVNTAFAFTLWNTALRTLTAVEAGIINNTMLIQVAILSWLFLEEPLSPKQIFAMLIVITGMIIVRLRRRSPQDHKSKVIDEIP
jgi:drug/metabolite transporter (DMT)-like permease